MNALRYLLLGLTALLIAALVWRMSVTPQPPSPGPAIGTPSASSGSIPDAAPIQNSEQNRPSGSAPLSMDDARSRLETSLNAIPDLAKVFNALRAQFPAIADGALARASQRASEQGGTVSADDLVANAMRDLRQSAGVLAAKATADKLSAIFDARAAILGSLAVGNPRVCADYWFGGTSPEYADFAAGHRALEAQAALASIAAAADGKTANVDHGTPTADDFKLIEDGLHAKSLTDDDIGFLLDGRSPDPPLPDDKVCADGKAYFDVLKSLPDDVRLRLYGVMIAAWARS